MRVTAACVCGSDLWPYRGINEVTKPTRIGHEFVGIVEEVGSEVRSLRAGDFVIAPFMYSDNTCPHCRVGIQSRCDHGGFWGGHDRDGVMVDGGQGEYVRVPLADGTLVVDARGARRRDGPQPADAVRRDGHRVACGGRRRACRTATPSWSSATAPWG